MGKKQGRPVRPRHVPERSCIACRAKRPKRELVRIVRTPDGRVAVDETGKRNGRGAYLCRRRSCWERALKRGSLARALRVPITAEMAEALRAYAATLPEELPERSEGMSSGVGKEEAG